LLALPKRTAAFLLHLRLPRLGGWTKRPRQRGAVLGEYLRLGNIWETVELLKQIQNATKIFTFDSETEIETLLWTR